MTIYAACGQAYAPDGREASARAVRQALDQIDHQSTALALVFASHEFPIEAVLSGAATILGNTPLIGLSTSGEFSNQESTRRSVSVALLAGEEIQARADWWPEYSQDSRSVAARLTASLPPAKGAPGSVFLLIADGFSGDPAGLCAALPDGDYPLAGCLAGGDLFRGRTYQIGGAQAGSGGLASAWISGEVSVGVGTSHGWQPVGAHFQVTRSHGPWVRALDGRPASEAYAHLFGHQPRDWAFPPLNELIHLYPLGVEQEDRDALLIRAPLRVEADGSLRMSTPVPEGSVCHLLVGSASACMQAARNAANQALETLTGARPVLAVILTDVAWQTLFEAQAGREIEAVREALGPRVPIAGGYTLGQIARAPASGRGELLNQHIEVILIGEKQS